MWIKEPTTFHDSMKPIVYFNCLLGMGVHWPPNTLSDTVYFCMKVYTVIFIPLYWIIIYIGLVVQTTDCGYFELSSSAVATMYIAVISVTSCMAVTSPLLVWLQSKVLRDCLRQIPILDDTFQDLFGARYEYRKQYIRLTWHVIAVVLVGSVTTILDMQQILLGARPLWNSFAISFTLHYPIFVTLVLDLNFYTFVGYLRKKFRDMNDGLLGLTKKPSASDPTEKILVIPRRVSKLTPSSRTNDMKAQSLTNDNRLNLLHGIRKAHSDLCKLSRKINAAFGIQNLLSTGISFAIVTGLLYNTYSAIVVSDVSEINSVIDICSSLFWIMIYMFKIWIVNHSCWIVSNEADRTGDVIYELLETRVNREFRKEIQEFAVQMLQNTVRFDACGFFTLDYMAVQDVIGSITTYLVILIQMDRSPARVISDTALAWNGTKILSNT